MRKTQQGNKLLSNTYITVVFILTSLNNITGNIFEAAEEVNFTLIYVRLRDTENCFFLL